MNMPDTAITAASRHGKYARPNVFEIDLGAVARCVRAIRASIGAETFFFATLKADAYGYGLLPVARTVLAAGADALSLARLDDAILLRESGIRAPILVYAGSVPGKDIVAAVETYDLIPTLHSDESLAAFAAHATREIKVAVKVEVGPERIGVTAEKAAAFVKAIARHPKLRMHVLNGHPSVGATGRLEESLAWQYRRFLGVCAELEQAGIKVPLKVVASSKVLRLTGKAMILNAADPGAALFSALNPADANGHYQPFRALKSRLIQVRETSRAEFLEEAPFRIVPGMRIGVIPIGYSDGMHRLNCGEFLVHGRRVAMLAAPALEYTRVDLTEVPAAAVGDEVVIIGAQNGGTISPEEIVKKQAVARVSDLALEVRPSVARVYLASE